MPVGFLNMGMLLGLSALAIPLLVHLLQRRHHEVIAWGAMQFLPSATSVRRRHFWDEFPLMILRMAIVALIALGLAGPYSTSALLAPLSQHRARDVVIILDGSYRMDRRDVEGRTPWAEARRWAGDYLEQLGRGDRAAMIVARQPPKPSPPGLTDHFHELSSWLDALPAPCGNAGLPEAVLEAWRVLQEHRDAAAQEIIVLTDRQRCAWADEVARPKWEALARQLRADRRQLVAAGQVVPRLRIFDVSESCNATLPNSALGPLTMSRTIAVPGQEVRFTSTLHRTATGEQMTAPRSRVAVDGSITQDVAIPGMPDPMTRQVPLRFTQRFSSPGRHVVSLTLDPGDRDALAADNEQFAVVEVLPELPVLLVEGARHVGREGSAFFLQKALAGSSQRGGIVPHVVSHAEITPADVLGVSGGRPRVIVLADVPDLPSPVQSALETYLADGGGILVMPGPETVAHAAFYNERLFRQGQGWLPAQVAGLAGSAGPSRARLDAQSVQHPALVLFRSEAAGGLADIRFPRWCSLRLNSNSIVVGRLTNGEPFLVEKAFGKGSAMISSVPPDRTWDSVLPGTPDFPVLVHELINYLVGARTSEWRLDRGQPLQIGPLAEPPTPERLIVQTPEIASRTILVKTWPWTATDTGAIGLYRVERENGSARFFVVPPDLREGHDQRCSEEEWTAALNLLSLDAGSDAEAIASASQYDLWWALLLGVIALLCCEVALTGRLVRRRTA
jgi:hypothetical protein